MTEDFRRLDDAAWTHGVDRAEWERRHDLLGRVVSLTAQLEASAATVAAHQYADAVKAERRFLTWIKRWGR